MPLTFRMMEILAQERAVLPLPAAPLAEAVDAVDAREAEISPEDRRRCARCHYSYLWRDLTYHGLIDGWVCPTCYEILQDEADRENEEEEPELYDYSFKPTPIFLPKWTKDNLFLGVELETDTYDHSHDTKIAIDQLWNLSTIHSKAFYLKQDGSLDYGFEIVTHPATLQYHQECFPWQEITTIVTSCSGKSHNTRTCGLHIHFNVDFYGSNTKEQNINTLKLLYLVERYWDRIATFSRRDSYSLNQWAKRYRKQFSNWTPEKLQIEKYNAPRNAAVNITNEDTLEVRVFRGTLHLPTILATIEFVDYLARTAKATSIQKLQRIAWTRFVKKIDPKIYPHLTPYLIQRRLIDVPDNYEAEASPTTEC